MNFSQKRQLQQIKAGIYDLYMDLYMDLSVICRIRKFFWLPENCPCMAGNFFPFPECSCLTSNLSKRSVKIRFESNKQPEFKKKCRTQSGKKDETKKNKNQKSNGKGAEDFADRIHTRLLYAKKRNRSMDYCSCDCAVGLWVNYDHIIKSWN